VAFSPDGKTVATGSQDQTARVWELTTGKPVATFQASKGFVNSLKFSSDGSRLITISENKTVKFWDLRTQNELSEFKPQGEFPFGISISSDGKLLAGARKDMSIELWDLNTQKQLTTLKGPERVFFMVFSPDNKTLVMIAGEKEAAGIVYGVWDVSTGIERGRIKETVIADSVPAFSGDCKTLAMPSEGKSVKLWDVATAQYLGALDWPDVEQAVFSPDNKKLAAISKDGKLKLWFAADEEEVRGSKR